MQNSMMSYAAVMSDINQKGVLLQLRCKPYHTKSSVCSSRLDFPNRIRLPTLKYCELNKTREQVHDKGKHDKRIVALSCSKELYSGGGGEEGKKKKTYVVTGGLGFVGSALCMELVRRGAAEVRALDIRPASTWSDQLKTHGVRIIQGDVSQRKDVDRALCGADCVFHLASFGDTGKEMLQTRRVNEVNINGTCHVLEACVEFDVERLVYLSTYNVVFRGEEILNGDESLPCMPVNDHVDPYACSKSMAEHLVLNSNGLPLKKDNGDCLRTCAIRSAAVYGPGEETHFSRIVSLAKLRLLLFRVGEAGVKTDWIYVDNLVLALISASMALAEEDIHGKGKEIVAAGQPYFVSDGSPVNTYEFMGPLLRGLDHEVPRTTLDVPHALFLGRIFWVIYKCLYPILNLGWLPQPLIIPPEVYQVGVSHYFSVLKAKEELGYSPAVTPQEGMKATILYWQDRKRKDLDGPSIYAWLFCLIGLPALFASALLPDRRIALLIFGSNRTIRIVTFICATVHISEAVYAWFLAKKVDPANAAGWFWQTLVCATFSLYYLWKRAKERAQKFS